MQIKNLSLSFGTQEIFQNIDLTINEKEKVGIVGVNGAGKTTFFKVILGHILPDSGSIKFSNNPRIGYLPQVIHDEIPSMHITVLEFLESGRPIEELNAQLQEVYKDISQETIPENQNRLFKTVDKILVYIENQKNKPVQKDEKSKKGTSFSQRPYNDLNNFYSNM